MCTSLPHVQPDSTKLRGENKAGQCTTLTPQLVVVRAALGLTTTVTHLTSVLLIVHPETELLALGNHK